MSSLEIPSEGEPADSQAVALYEPPPGGVIVAPVTGEVIDLSDAGLCLKVLNEIRDLERQLREAKSELTGALSEEFRRRGKKTMEVNGIKAELRGGSETVWDVEILEQLRALGLPEDRMDELVKAEVTYKVNAAVAKQLSSANPDYAAVIQRAKTEIPKAQYVTIKSG